MATKKPSNNILIAVVALILVLLLVAFLKPKGELVQNDTSSPSAPIANGTEPTAQNTSTNFTATFPDDWNGFERAEKNIQSLSEGQRIQFYVVQDPTNVDISYFASSSFNAETQENLVSVYAYNTSDYSFERLYRATFGAGDYKGLSKQAIPAFHVVGYDSGRLVILAEDTDDSPGPCTEPVLLGAHPGTPAIRQLVSMDLADPYSGFEPYTLPEEVSRVATDREASCQKEQFGQ